MRELPCIRSLALLCAVLSLGDAAPLDRGRAKRRNTWYEPVLSAADSLLDRCSELLHLQTPSFAFHMDADGARESLVDALWSDLWTENVANRFTTANPALRYLLEMQHVDDQPEVAFRGLQGQSRWEAVMSAIFRARSQLFVPIETAALSIMWLYYRVPKPVWQATTYFGRFVMSRFWTEEICDLAMQRDPGPNYPVAQGLTAAVFDNLSMQVGYASYSVAGQAGHKIEMTNWATVFLPAAAMPNGFAGIDAILGSGGIFKPLLNLDEFLDGFSRLSDDIVQNQKARWLKFLNVAAQGGSVWDADARYDSPYPQTRFHFHTPIFDRLQSSYEDVNFEIDLMRRSTFHALSDALMLGGDGLSFMRMIHRISQDPRRYLETKPLIIPRMGENPHGLYHFMHGDWRIWAPLLLRLAAVVGNKQVKADPTIVDFNTHQHFLRVVTEALTQYVLEISSTGTHYGACQHFLRDAERNLSFAYVVFFLFMFGFKYLDYRRAVRHNESRHLDLLWRENLASARTAKANKTNYRQMSVVLVYWGCALVEPLQTFYHNTRTIRWVHSHVGWDMPIEKLNMWIKESVITNISELQIIKFIHRLNFMQHIARVVKGIVWSKRKQSTSALKDIDPDVQAILDFLRSKIGTTYIAATCQSDANLLSVDMADWGGLRTPRGSAPFNQIRGAQFGYREYVRTQVAKLCPWQRWS